MDLLVLHVWSGSLVTLIHIGWVAVCFRAPGAAFMDSKASQTNSVYQTSQCVSCHLRALLASTNVITMTGRDLISTKGTATSSAKPTYQHLLSHSTAFYAPDLPRKERSPASSLSIAIIDKRKLRLCTTVGESLYGTPQFPSTDGVVHLISPKIIFSARKNLIASPL